jgi:UPF0716 protein FxsA
MPVLIFIVYVIAELAALIWVGGAIGVLPTIGLLILGSVLGGALLRREGRRTMQALRASQNQHSSPATELADGALLGVGAFLLLIPGFVSDLAGLLLILPPTRAVLRPVVKASVARRVQVVGSGMWARTRTSGGRGEVIDGEVIAPDSDTPPNLSKRGLRSAPERPFGQSRQ